MAIAHENVKCRAYARWDGGTIAHLISLIILLPFWSAPQNLDTNNGGAFLYVKANNRTKKRVIKIILVHIYKNTIYHKFIKKSQSFYMKIVISILKNISMNFQV